MEYIFLNMQSLKSSTKKKKLLFIVFLFIGVFAFSQENKVKSPDIAIDVQLSGGAFLIIPEAKLTVSVPVNFGDKTVSLVPGIGFCYLFNIWDDIHSSMYIPVGAALIYNPFNIGLSVKYYLSISNILTERIIEVGVRFLLPAADFGKMKLLFNLEFGTGIFWGVSIQDIRYPVYIDAGVVLRFPL